MFKTLTVLESVIENLAAGLTDPKAIDRLTRGVLYTQIVDPAVLDRATFNKTIIPIFAQLIRQEHRFEVPILQYMMALVEFIDEMDYTVVTEPIPSAPGEDREADVLEMLLYKFKVEYDAETEA